jgi:hypothetical protein
VQSGPSARRARHRAPLWMDSSRSCSVPGKEVPPMTSQGEQKTCGQGAALHLRRQVTAWLEDTLARPEGG